MHIIRCMCFYLSSFLHSLFLIKIYLIVIRRFIYVFMHLFLISIFMYLFLLLHVSAVKPFKNTPARNKFYYVSVSLNVKS
jgi:hypothetical protein